MKYFFDVGTGVTANSLHPGVVDTEIIRHLSFFNSWISKIFLYPFLWPFIKSPRQGAQTTIYAAVAPELEKVTGKYFRLVIYNAFDLFVNYKRARKQNRGRK